MNRSRQRAVQFHMVYLLALGVIAAVFAFIRRVRIEGLWRALLDIAVAIVSGWIAGLLIGIGARIGMWAIPVFNGASWEFTAAGSLQVVLVFSLYGIGLGIIYELLFRQMIANRGLVFGALITAIAAYPLATAAIQQLTFSPGLLPAAAASLFFTGLMFVPFAVFLEFLLSKYHTRRTHPGVDPQNLQRRRVEQL